ncbi:RNase P subunit p30, partial [Dichotomocladium elegans]
NYQLVALRTSDEKVFEDACRSYMIDIISMDCTKRLPFRLDPMLVKEAMRRGIFFEINYGPGIQDLTQRAYLLQMSKEVASVTNAEHFIVSSEAADVSVIRAPFDIYHL